MSAWVGGPHCDDASGSISRSKKKSLELVLDEEPEGECGDEGHRAVAPVTRLTVDTSSAPSTDAIPPNEYIDDLVREFFQVYHMTEALEAFAKEKPIVPRDAATIDFQNKQLHIDSGEPLKSRLESFVRSWNQVEHGIGFQSTPKKEKKPKKSKPAGLKLNAANDDVHTEEAPASRASVLDFGVPGCTPKPRMQDLKNFGFDDLDDEPAVASVPTTPPNFALELIKAKSHSKKVSIGEEGLTPKKEYIFYRETPPSFVTESEEAAREVMEKLSHDPKFELPPQEAPPRLVELSSSDVGKYEIGKRVEGLGAKREISGIVTKKYGSKQCGLSGPGTIVIDTQVHVILSSHTIQLDLQTLLA
ncbi:Aste57867_11634 [Aphanomyces stellatus]|uniref:Aste57867_11634 protein n=1 Tax=Aphanomyces stellatus TaxID=120398 RepID=A0A485KTJ4_9STRA|nr:hypothetical protein As57867_011591 [Aphanomyces stellatus]VFT88492.1 Aste57867_11634 [Aphanomyces stellatus]